MAETLDYATPDRRKRWWQRECPVELVVVFVLGCQALAMTTWFWDGYDRSDWLAVVTTLGIGVLLLTVGLWRVARHRRILVSSAAVSVLMFSLTVGISDCPHDRRLWIGNWSVSIIDDGVGWCNYAQSVRPIVPGLPERRVGRR